jgi:integrase
MRPRTLQCAVLPPLMGVLSYAVERRHILVSPAAKLGKYVRANDVPEERVDPFTREELSTLLETARSDMPEWHPFLLTAARTGLRFGELTALRPDDLDFRGRAILIRRAAYRGTVSTPKSGKARRVDMSRQLAETLRGYLSVREAEAVVAGGTPPPWLFTDPTGRLVNHRWFYHHVWWPLLRRSEVLRHSFATALIAQGESLAYVRDQLGHHSISLTVDTYGHLLPGSNRQAVDRLDDPEPASTRNPRATAGAVSG